MKSHSPTSRDAKEAREALLKRLTELPTRDKTQERALAERRKRAIASARPATAPGVDGKR